MSKRIKVIRTIEVTLENDMDSYGGMTEAEAVEYERNIPDAEAIESAGWALDAGEGKVTSQVSVIDVPES